MKIFEYKNISTTLIFATITIILSNTLLISLVYYNSQIQQFESTIENMRTQNIEEKKEKLKNDIIFQVVMLKFKYEKEIQNNKEKIKEYLSRIPYDKEKSDYIFIYELLNKKGGDNFARLILNPNRQDLQGKLISTNYKDINGFKFREQFLNDINKDGESFVSYTYSKTNQKIAQKISYFYYFKELNWVLAKGIYIDDIKNELALKKKQLKSQLFEIIKENIVLYTLFTFVMIILAYFMGKKVASILKEKDKKVKFTTKELARINRNLDSKVKEEIEKNKEKEQLLMQKSKFIALGEMISLIAHQWRQPISEISAIIMNLKMHHRMNKLEEDVLLKKTNDIENILDFMSQTIDDFRYFFKPDKTQQTFYINDSITRVTKIIQPMLHENNIELIHNFSNKISIHNFQNEFEQVLLNLITNAKDALVSDQIKNPKIVLEIKNLDNKIVISVIDNANGVDPTIKDKIFDPYFTTKDEANGTGIGLYMSKIIIEKNMKGELLLESSPNGSSFTIILHK